MAGSLAAFLFLSACGGGEDASPDTTPPQSDNGTSDTEAPDTTVQDVSSTAAATPDDQGVETASPAILEDPVGDLLSGSVECGDPSTSFDLARLTIEPRSDGFTATLEGHTPGPVRQVQIFITDPDGPYYDARARADGNGTFDGGGSYAWDLGAEVSLTGESDSYTAEVTELVLEAGWTVSVEVRSNCDDLVEGILD